MANTDLPPVDARYCPLSAKANEYTNPQLIHLYPDIQIPMASVEQAVI